MAQSLEQPVALGKTVYAIEQPGQGVRVHCTDHTHYDADFLVCTIPMPLLRQVIFEPRLTGPLAGAVSEIDYGLSIQVHYRLTKDYAEEDGLPAGMWTDTPVERFTTLNRGPDGTASSAIAFVNGNEVFKYDFMTDRQVADFTTQAIHRHSPVHTGSVGTDCGAKLLPGTPRRG